MRTDEAICICQTCGGSMITPAAFGQCPGCLMQLGIAAAIPASSPRALQRCMELQRIGDYELLRQIGRGGMGVVFEARQTSLNRIVALKLVLESHFNSPLAVRRFEIEAEATARLGHPNIVPIFEIGNCDDQPFISMRLIDGESLARCIAEGHYDGARAKVPGKDSKRVHREIVMLLAKVARAVHYAHEHGVLHRDIKPGNILIDVNGEPHLTDFGLAKLTDADHDLSQSGMVIGTPNYLAPELAAGGLASLASDVYSLGAILYELLTGRIPFKAATSVDLLRQVAEAPPSKPRALNPSMDRDLETICLKCLEKDPADRYASARSLAADLGRWERDEPVVARPISPLVRAARWSRRHIVGTALIVSLLLVGILSFRYQAAVKENHEQAEESNRRQAEERRREKLAHRNKIYQLLGAQTFWANQRDSIPVTPDLIAYANGEESVAPAAPNSVEIHIGVFVEEDPVDAIEGYAPLISELRRAMSQALARPVLFHLQLYRKDSEQAVADLVAHRVDVLKTGGNWYLKGLRRDPGLRPLVGQDPAKRVVIFTRKETGIFQLTELNTSRIIRSDGTIGLWGAYYLGKAGVPNQNITVVIAKRVQTKKAGKKVTADQPALEGVLSGDFDAGIVQEKHFQEHERNEELVAIATENVSRVYWLASSKLDEAHAAHLKHALINLSPQLFKAFPDKVTRYSEVTEEEITRLMEAGDAVEAADGDSK